MGCASSKSKADVVTYIRDSPAEQLENQTKRLSHTALDRVVGADEVRKVGETKIGVSEVRFCAGGCGKRAADGFETCCRTCLSSGGSAHGPTCQHQGVVDAVAPAPLGAPCDDYINPASLYALTSPRQVAADLSPVAILCGGWLLQLVARIRSAGEDVEAKKALSLPCRQVLEHAHAEAFLTLKQVVALDVQGTPDRRRLKLLVISYAWLTKEHPDPFGDSLKMLGIAIERAQSVPSDRAFPKDFGVFMDWPSLHQLVNGRRTKDEQAAFGHALSNMQLWYAHQLTTVCMLCALPKDWKGKVTAYGERGWPTFEKSLAVMIKPCYGVLSWPSIITVGQANAIPVPSTPQAFNSLLETKTFTNGHDADRVKRLYEKTFNDVIHGAQRLDWGMTGGVVGGKTSTFSWGDAQIEELVAEILPHCTRLKDLSLNNNNIGSRGCAALASVGSASIQVLDVRNNPIDDVGFFALAESIKASRFPKLNRLWLAHCKAGPAGRNAIIDACRAKITLSFTSCHHSQREKQIWLDEGLCE